MWRKAEGKFNLLQFRIEFQLHSSSRPPPPTHTHTHPLLSSTIKSAIAFISLSAAFISSITIPPAMSDDDNPVQSSTRRLKFVKRSSGEPAAGAVVRGGSQQQLAIRRRRVTVDRWYPSAKTKAKHPHCIFPRVASVQTPSQPRATSDDDEQIVTAAVASSPTPILPAEVHFSSDSDADFLPPARARKRGLDDEEPEIALHKQDVPRVEAVSKGGIVPSAAHPASDAPSDCASKQVSSQPLILQP
jgi:hypothetical protein